MKFHGRNTGANYCHSLLKYWGKISFEIHILNTSRAHKIRIFHLKCPIGFPYNFVFCKIFKSVCILLKNIWPSCLNVGIITFLFSDKSIYFYFLTWSLRSFSLCISVSILGLISCRRSQLGPLSYSLSLSGYPYQTSTRKPSLHIRIHPFRELSWP